MYARSAGGTLSSRKLMLPVLAGVSNVSKARGIGAVGLSYRRDNLTELNIFKAAQDSTAYVASTPSTFYQANLDTHNRYRARHTNTGQLSWDDAVANSAATYASRCADAAHEVTGFCQPTCGLSGKEH